MYSFLKGMLFGLTGVLVLFLAVISCALGKYLFGPSGSVLFLSIYCILFAGFLNWAGSVIINKE